MNNSFFTKMIQYFNTNYGISKKKVFVIGFSGGGHMAFKLAQTIPQKFGGICTIVANLPDTSNNDCVLVKKQIPVLMVNGTADIVSPYLGGYMNTTGVSLGTVQSVENTFKYWAKVNGVFSDTPILGLTQLRDTLNNTTAITKYYSKPLKPKTTLISITNGKHELPKLFDVFEVAWEFFKSEMERKRY
jgi:polyhydroxybutyrate depolymerase